MHSVARAEEGDQIARIDGFGSFVVSGSLVVCVEEVYGGVEVRAYGSECRLSRWHPVVPSSPSSYPFRLACLSAYLSVGLIEKVIDTD